MTWTTSNDCILFKDFITDNAETIKTYMTWKNYDLNETIIPVVEEVQNDSLTVLSNSYGMFHVEQSILNEFCADVFIHFPVLLQQLAITRLIDAFGVVKNDTETQTTERTETVVNSATQNSEVTQGTTQTSTNEIDTEQTTTGTIQVEVEVSNSGNSTTNIENSSDVEATGSRNVTLAHNLPEQAIETETGDFETDAQGTPILSTSYAQQAQEDFSTANPIATVETSEQTIVNSNSGTNDSTTTNNVTVADSGTNTQTTVNSGSDTSESTTETTGTNTINETITNNVTNKQYAYEIKAFLETADSLIAFEKWVDKFSWVVGII